MSVRSIHYTDLRPREPNRLQCIQAVTSKSNNSAGPYTKHVPCFVKRVSSDMELSGAFQLLESGWVDKSEEVVD